MKNTLKFILQKLLGYERYLFVFAKFKIGNLKSDKKEGDFFKFMDQIHSEGVLLDVGANLGIMSYHLAKSFPTREIIAFEPEPQNLSILKKIKTFYKLENLYIQTVAVGSKVNETLKMVLPLNGKVKMQGLSHVVHDTITEWNDGIEFTVNSTTIDSIIKDKKVAGMKMDIENFEHFALLGSKKLLERDKPVVYLELWDNENRYKCFQLLKSIGYKVFVNFQDKLETFDSKKHQNQNFIFLPS